MANQQYIQRLEQAIRHLHNCDSAHLETVPVHETFEGKTVWQGDVEVFVILGHRRATKCYAWAAKNPHGGEQFTAVLGTAPVRSATAAVRVSIVTRANEHGYGV